jgi:NAD(P)-dependent dehydrogenase (short-subunit alcohol dehydrogenase family)
MGIRTTVVGSWWIHAEDEGELARHFAGKLTAAESEALLTRAAAKELGRYGITVNAICPGMIDTELTHENAPADLLERLAASYPVPRLGKPLEVADLICFVASEEAGYITGASFDITGGDLMM